MRLTTSDTSQSLELVLRGYREAPDEYYFLTVEARVEHPLGSWSFRDPCLTPAEAFSLAAWLESLNRGAAAQPELSFIEPNLRFVVGGPTGAPTLRVYFELEARPDWAPSDSADEDDLWVEFPLSDLDLSRCARSLRSQLSSLPAYRV
jgi:hypothetical protein